MTTAPDLTTRILHRDDDILILDKPAGLPVDPPRTGGPSVTTLAAALRFGKRRDPRPAHRLDQDTAGCLILGRTAPALARLGALFAEGAVLKTYWAVVHGTPPHAQGVIDAPLAKRSTARDGWRMVVAPDAQRAVTRWRVLGSDGARTWVELQPETGRTHQLRAHCAHLGCPMAGDTRYGGTGAALHLLARAIAFQGVAATAHVPPHMHAALTALGYA